MRRNRTDEAASRRSKQTSSLSSDVAMMHDSTYPVQAPRLPETSPCPALESNGAAPVAARVGKSDPEASRALPPSNPCHSNVHDSKAPSVLEEGGTDASFSSNGNASKLPDSSTGLKANCNPALPPLPALTQLQNAPDMSSYPKSYQEIVRLTKDVFAISWEPRYPLKDSPGKGQCLI